MIALTYFSSKLDSNPDGKTIQFPNWNEFADYLVTLSGHAGKKPRLGDEVTSDCSPLLSPAMFKQGEKRRKENVIGWAGWAALDIDDFEGSIDSFDNRNLECVLYSTASSRPDTPAFRIVLPLTRWIKNEEIPQFWYALNMHFLGIGDPQAKDTCRIYYVPAQYPDAHNFIVRRQGNYLDPDWLMSEYPMPKLARRRLMDKIPAHMQKAIREERHQLLLERGINLNWTTYRDCPFVNKKLVDDYKSHGGRGYYHRFYSIMVSIASIATKMGYAITASEIEDIMREIDAETGDWYTRRPIRDEAENAIQFARSRA